jgi:hypothetical protein
MIGHPIDVTLGLRIELLNLLSVDLAAIWLYGASVFGQPFGDVDLHILLRRQLTAVEWAVVGETHVRLAREFRLSLDDLDFWYISLQDAVGSSSPQNLAPWGKGKRDEHWPLHRAHWIARRCEVVHGPEPSAVVQPPSWEELDVVLRRELRAPTPSAYWVLQLCRVWASLAMHDVVRSKVNLGNWALEVLAPDYHDIVIAAIHVYEDKGDPCNQSLIRERFPALLAEVRRQVDHA